MNKFMFKFMISYSMYSIYLFLVIFTIIVLEVKIMKQVRHTLQPIYNQNSKVLILGTMPSVRSRELGFYYAHPKNRFWPTMESVFQEKIEDKVDFLLNHSIALWDVLASCSIKGSSDASIKNAKPNHLKKIIKESQIKIIFTTGKTAFRYYEKFFKNQIHLPVICLPSTSPANCKVKTEELIKEYQIIKKYINVE